MKAKAIGRRKNAVTPQALLLMMIVFGAVVVFCVDYGLVKLINTESTSKDCFDLCGVSFCSQKMPAVQKNTTFGLPGWKRNASKAIILQNATGSLFGQSGNNIREFFHAFDMAFDEEAELVLYDYGFPINIPLSQFYSEIDLQFLESELGVTIFDGSRKYAENTTVKTAGLFYYKTKLTREQRLNHRHYILQKLYRHLANQIELSNNKELENRICLARQRYGIQRPHVVIHSRFHYYPCVDAMKGNKTAAVSMPPDLILGLMTQYNMTDSRILMIHDGTENAQNTSIKLAGNALTGPHFEMIPHSVGNPFSDMMLAILSDLFIGNPSSTFAWYIAEVRFALGLGLGTHIFYKKESDGTWVDSCCGEVCLYSEYCSTYG